MYALAGGAQGISYPALTLYAHLGDAAALFDVKEGGNGFCDAGGLACGANLAFGETVDCEGTTSCNAAPGYEGGRSRRRRGTPQSSGRSRKT